MDKTFLERVLRTIQLMTKREDGGYVDFTSSPSQGNPCPWIEIRQSTHGRGLFATNHIKKGDFITMYPIHQLGHRLEEDTWQIRSHGSATQTYEDYSLNINDNLRIFGDPNLTSNQMFLGHMVNDPVLDLEEKDPLQLAVRYFIACKARANATFYRLEEPWIGIQAVRDIKPGEEILVPYSLPYWEKKTGIKMEEIDKAIKHYMETAPVQKAKFLLNLMEDISKTFQ